MKTVTLIIASITLIATFSLPVMATNRYHNQREFDLGVGVQFPSDAKAGFVYQLELWNRIDQMVLYGFGLDIFHTSFTDQTLIGESGNPAGGSGFYAQEGQFDFLMFSPMGGIKVHLLNPNNSWSVSASAGAGLDLLFASEVFATDSTYHKDSKFYLGVGGKINAAVSRKLGDYTWLTGMLGWHFGVPSRNSEPSGGLSVKERINMGGLMLGITLRIGLNL